MGFSCVYKYGLVAVHAPKIFKIFQDSFDFIHPGLKRWSRRRHCDDEITSLLVRQLDISYPLFLKTEVMHLGIYDLANWINKWLEHLIVNSKEEDFLSILDTHVPDKFAVF